MSEKDKAKLVECGIDYAEGVEKFLDEEELYCGLLVDFLTENTFDEAKECLVKGDDDGFLRAVHAMKSVTGTLSMNKLYRLCFDSVDEFRSGRIGEAKATFRKAYKMYTDITACISTVLDGHKGSIEHLSL